MQVAVLSLGLEAAEAEPSHPAERTAPSFVDTLGSNADADRTQTQGDSRL